MVRTVTVGTRGSTLALRQTALVVEALRAVSSNEFVVEVVHSEGDVRADAPLSTLARGVFVKTLEDALLEKRIDLAVHSLKDLPVDPATGLEVVAVPIREDPHDVLVSAGGLGLDDLPKGARIGTSSPRRAAQLRLVRPDVTTEPLRGNVETRIRKVDGGGIDAALLAAAGVRRLGLDDRITQTLEIPAFLPAPGQGALAVEARQGNEPAAEDARRLDDPDIRACVSAEREFLRALGGGCLQPVGALAEIQNGELVLWAGRYTDKARTARVAGAPETAEDMGRRAAAMVTTESE